MRRTIRLAGYDYTQSGAYFITLTTKDRARVLGEVTAGRMRLSRLGEIARDEWLKTDTIREEVELDVFQVMPDHLHAVMFLRGATGGDSGAQAHSRAPVPGCGSTLARPARSLGSLVAGFKSAVTVRINTARGTPGVAVWQRNYFERVIRSQRELQRIREYILDNPRRWHDKQHGVAPEFDT